MQSFNPYLDISPEVQSALDNHQPVVALESTIISHGMPYPQNLETAKGVEAVVRKEGAIPATMAVIKGRIKVGLSEEDLLFMAKEKGILKASRRDMAIIIAQKKSAATTVAATMICANLAGIKIFATGGIGGVHRKGQDTFDISADLQELANTPVAVVSAGIKSILDIPLTLEYLETMGVAVIGVGTDQFPAFYTRESGYPAPYQLDTPGEIAATIQAQESLGLKAGFLIANPIPAEYSMDKKIIDKAIREALADAEAQQITGKEVTPFLLKKIVELTEGKSLFSNIKLVENNARLAAQIARELSVNNHKN
ncbi:MAG: pseudouridine-5'-phosphate glycosidase [Bacteroidetes bacterium]|nr:pseudouridine-5'-phosphate glycosidase [Bacteroidota bacterium]